MDDLQRSLAGIRRDLDDVHARMDALERGTETIKKNIVDIKSYEHILHEHLDSTVKASARQQATLDEHTHSISQQGTFIHQLQGQMQALHAAPASSKGYA